MHHGIRVAAFGDTADDGAPDDNGLGMSRDSADVVGGGHAKADSDGEGRDLADAGDLCGQIVWDRVALASDAGAGDVVDEAAGVCGDQAEALIGAGRCGEEDGVDAGAVELALERRGFFRGHVEDEDAIHARGGGFFGETRKTEAVDGIQIREKDNRDLRTVADLADEVDDVIQSNAVAQGTFRGFLVGFAVGEGIGERDAEFDQVGASLLKCKDKLGSARQRRVTCCDVNYQASAVGLPKEVEFLINAIHRAIITIQGEQDKEKRRCMR